MDADLDIIRRFDWRNFGSDRAFAAWRDAKIRAAERLLFAPPIAADSLTRFEENALSELRSRCAAVNFAQYETAHEPPDQPAACAALAGFSRALGLPLPENHRSAGELGIVALQTSDAPSKRGYIPYTTRPLNWHTDGYYAATGAPVMAFILHCHQQAATGGVNQIADPEMAYLRMREASPAFVTALMHPQAMTIPENREPDGTVRPVSVGPVFFADPLSGRLQMRYTARTRSITWRDDPATKEATAWLQEWLQGDDPLILRLRLRAGQGMVTNNVLHNRTGFDDGAGHGVARVMLRVRFHQRLAEEFHGAT